MRQPEVNIGVVGHVDHGKTTLVQALTGIWTARHSDEIKRGMTIKLGYADGNIAYCEHLEPPDAYTTEQVCPDGSESKLLRRVSFVDAPGHEALMATMLSGSSLMDGAILVIAANEPCPQPQTLEHFSALNIIGIKHLVIVQNKIDVVSRERALENYKEILKLINGTPYENSPIIPVSALHKSNIDVLLQALYEEIPVPERDTLSDPIMLVARSFEVNRPGTSYKDLRGGVVGGSLIKGVLRVGDEIEIVPGAKVPAGKTGYKYEPLVSTVEELRFGELKVEEARPGGLLAIGTKLDPSLTKADSLVGNIVGKPGRTPPVVDSLEISYKILERVVGVKEMSKMPPLQNKEMIVLTIGTAVRVGTITKLGQDTMEVELKEPVATWTGSRVALSRRVLGRWRLSGWGIIEAIASRGR
ncbi:translation initiation factor IF-2 subunit gamma [Thermogladius sp. 4427co]|uniref:translation initiation factor IF-2 subunit gamma n=1 Tax=Thermogladius sp. 4427co TaxID=3450718 RepID=UPI003F797125